MRNGLIVPALALIVICAAACGDSTGSGGGGSPGSGGSASGGAPSTGGGGTGGSGGAAPMTPCEEICAFDDQLEAQINCGYTGATCISDCETGFDQTPMDCHDEAIAYNDCLMQQPVDSYNCTNMVFTLATDACDTELGALTACVGG